jgi:hypothetical protein
MNYSAYVGLDVHKATIAIAIAEVGRAADWLLLSGIGNRGDGFCAGTKADAALKEAGGDHLRQLQAEIVCRAAARRETPGSMRKPT